MATVTKKPESTTQPVTPNGIDPDDGASKRYRLLDDRVCVRYQDPKLPIGQGPLRWFKEGDIVDFDNAIGFDRQHIQQLVAMGCLGDPDQPVEKVAPAPLTNSPAKLGDPFVPDHADEA
jgi:hypothetical protein